VCPHTIADKIPIPMLVTGWLLCRPTIVGVNLVDNDIGCDVGNIADAFSLPFLGTSSDEAPVNDIFISLSVAFTAVHSDGGSLPSLTLGGGYLTLSGLSS
jgi:hypothetical protein